MHTLAEALWRHYSKRDSVDRMERGKLIQELCNHEDKMLFFVKVAAWPHQQIEEKSLRLLLSWLSYGETLTPPLEAALLRICLPLTQPLDASVSAVAARISPLLSDVADDLAKIIVCTLKSSEPVSLEFHVSSGFTPIMTPEVLWLLSITLTSPFKRPCVSRLRYSSPLEIEQLAHIHLLYDSSSHGFSVTRIKELAFDYDGPLILFLRAEKYLFCLASDQGLKDSLRTFGAENSLLLQIQPDFIKLVSGRSPKLAGPAAETGIIYANFTARSARRGLLIGHQPLASPVVEVNEGFTELRFAGGPPMKLMTVEIWAAGSPDSLTKLQAQKAWDLAQIKKEKNRKVLQDEDWRDTTDRQILSMAGIKVNYSTNLELHEAEVFTGIRNGNQQLQDNNL
ncbi:unnamed protein product [Dicrocoelium dendriticum]|nr:unnamed protein product [Dicrocoelium dendriticum]